jgi:hypothetical protein
MLTNSQQTVLDKFEDWILSGVTREFVVAGHAGTGKSYLIRHMIDVLQATAAIDAGLGIEDTAQRPRLSGEYYVCATTNKAVNVLANFTGTQVDTIHRLLGLRVVNNYQTGEQILQQTNNGIPEEELKHALVFIDEAFMIDYELLTHIRKQCRYVVYVGDPYQLPPVNYKMSPVANLEMHHLLEIQRQKQGSGILPLASRFRQLLKEGPPFVWPEFVDAPDIEIIDNEMFKTKVIERFQHSSEIDDVRILAWTNKRVIGYNRFVRDLFTQSLQFVPGDLVITNKPIVTGTKGHGPLYHHVDTSLRIKTVSPETTYKDVPGQYVSFHNSHAVVFQPLDPALAKAKIKEASRAKDWREYFHSKETFGDLRSGYSLTIHKSQGSTYKEVFIDLEDISRNTKWYDIARLVYVGLTRATDKVYVFGQLKNRPQHTRENQ